MLDLCLPHQRVSSLAQDCQTLNQMDGECASDTLPWLLDAADSLRSRQTVLPNS